MNIRNIIFAAIVCCNIFITKTKEENYSQQSSITGEEIILKKCNARLDALEEEEKTQYSHTNYCWGGTLTGLGLIVLGLLNNEHQGKLVSTGIALFLGSSGVGVVSIYNENEKAKRRQEERNSIYNQLRIVSKK